MSSNFRDFTIESVGGKIQNVSSLCSYIKNTPIESEDIPYLESLRNKLANDNRYNDIYLNEEQIVNVLEEELLKYYIKNDNFGLDNIINLLDIYNESFIYLDKVKYDGLTYLIHDEENDIDVVSVSDEQRFIDLVLTNASIFANKSLNEIFTLMKQSLKSITFSESTDETAVAYADKFNIDYPIYEGYDINGNKIFKIKNGLFIKRDNELISLLSPTLVKDEEHKDLRVIKKNKKYSSFDLDEFIDLRDRVLDCDVTDKQELEKFYFQVRYLINTMNRRTHGEDPEYTEALDEYMDSLIRIYESHPDLLSKSDTTNVKAYLNNRNKISRKQ